LPEAIESILERLAGQSAKGSVATLLELSSGDQSKLSSAQDFEKLLISKLLEGKRSFPSLDDWALGAMVFYEILQLSMYCGWSLLRSRLLPRLFPPRLARLDLRLIEFTLIDDFESFGINTANS
jgi:hypothetical protein